jgi:multimeric flavodoxin WrbA
MSIKVQVIFYSMYGHVYKMAQAVAEGVKQVSERKFRYIRSQNLFPMTYWTNMELKPPKLASRTYR